MPGELIVVIVLALLFDFLNGVHNSSNIVATMISSRAFRPQTALTLTAVSHFLGPFIFGVAVAKTIGDEVAETGALTLHVITACLIGAILWNLLTWFLGIPSSSSHALIGGLVGAIAMGAGFDAIKLSGLEKVLIALFTSPIIGFALGFVIMRFIFFLVRGATPGINEFFKRAQLRTLGGKFYKIRPVHSFASQLTSGIVILTASLFGGPVSTTQVVSSAIIGVGSAERLGKVGWSVAGDIVTAWIVTIPATALLSAGIYLLLAKIPARTGIF